MRIDQPHIEDSHDGTIYVFSTLGRGPKGEKGDRGDLTAPIYADPLEWDPNRDYPDLSVVMFHGDSFTSKRAVPDGIDIHNKSYWVRTANFNAQLQAVQDKADKASDMASRALSAVQSLSAITDEEIDMIVDL